MSRNGLPPTAYVSKAPAALRRGRIEAACDILLGMEKPLPTDAYPHPSSPEVRRRMLACGPRDTAPELALRSALFRLGLRFRLDRRPIPSLRRKADILFPRLKIAVFVDGCFWHACPEHSTWPKANAEFWRLKIVGNRARDLDTDRRLAEAGWLSLRVWEHEDPVAAAERIAEEIRKRRLDTSS